MVRGSTVRVRHSNIYGLADTMAPPKGLAVSLGPRQMLLQAEGATALGHPEEPILIELNEKSTGRAGGSRRTCGTQAFRLSRASWRGFNARSKSQSLCSRPSSRCALARQVGNAALSR